MTNGPGRGASTLFRLAFWNLRGIKQQAFRALLGSKHLSNKNFCLFLISAILFLYICRLVLYCMLLIVNKKKENRHLSISSHIYFFITVTALLTTDLIVNRYLISVFIFKKIKSWLSKDMYETMKVVHYIKHRRSMVYGLEL